MDEPGQASGTGSAGDSAWRGNGVSPGTHAYREDQPWSDAGESEPTAEPLALLPPHQRPSQEYPQPGGRRYAPGLDDDTPVAGTPAMEPPPPLWREAARYSPSPPLDYGARLADYTVAPPPAPPPPAPEPPDPTTTGPEPVEPAGLPQRVPAEPDVPEVPGSGPGNRERWTAPELAWIADQLKRDDVPQVPTEGFDVDAVLGAVRDVPGVRTASVRPNPDGVHTLRLDLADDADPGQVSRLVARLLEERMGLSASPQEPPSPPPRTPAPVAAQAPPAAQTRPAPPEPRFSQAVAAPRGPVPVGETVPAIPAPRPALPDGDEPELPSGRRSRPEAEPPGAGPAVAGPPPGFSHPGERSRLRHRAPEPEAPPDPAADHEAAAATEYHQLAYAGRESYGADCPERAAEPEPGPVEVPEVVSRPLYPPQPGLRVVLDHVRVSTVGLDATVEVQLTAGEYRAHGLATGPAVDAHVIRLAAVAAANAIDTLLRDAGTAEPPPTTGLRCSVEHTGVVPFGSTEVAVVVLLLVCGGWVEQLTGSALVDGDPRQAMVRATLGAVNRRLEALLG